MGRERASTPEAHHQSLAAEAALLKAPVAQRSKPCHVGNVQRVWQRLLAAGQNPSEDREAGVISGTHYALICLTDHKQLLYGVNASY